MPDEIFDVVDENDHVIGQATRAEVHRAGLRHRAVHVFAFDPNGRLLVQTRSETKDEYPLCYTSSASGHVDTGESYDEAARRELLEELGLTGPLEFLVKLPAGPQTANEHTVLYRTDCDPGDVEYDRTEIASVEFCSLETIREMLAREPQRFSPPFHELLDWYLRSPSGTM